MSHKRRPRIQVVVPSNTFEDIRRIARHSNLTMSGVVAALVMDKSSELQEQAKRLEKRSNGREESVKKWVPHERKEQ